jgi:outer membrane receptor protein involved in Fe transport
MFLRTDTNLASVETIRGGSASTFASNSPGGVINLISKTGEEAEGLIRVTEGLDFGEHRVQMDYGRPLGDGWRFHVGGFYRKGDGPAAPAFRTSFGVARSSST